MTTYERKTVLDQILEECTFAYHSKTAPLIFLSTEDLELVERVALLGGADGRLVPLKRAQVSDSDPLAPYYEYLGTRPDELEKCLNLSYDFQLLRNFPVDKAGKPPRTPDGDPIDLPFLFILHIGKETSGEVLQTLRDYIRRYLHRTDPHSVLRRSCVLLYGSVGRMQEDLLKHTKIVEEPYPESWEIGELLRQKMEEYRVPPFVEDSTRGKIARDLTGFSVLQAERIIQSLLLSDDANGRPLLFHPDRRTQIIQRNKVEALLQNGGILELVKRKDKPATPAGTLCGMGRYQDWVKESTERMKDPGKYTQRRGALPLKGLLMCGVSGCGKSEAARLLAGTWNLPLVKMNMDRLMGGLMGDSERNLRTALAQAESMAPCIVWMDEVDKALSGASASNQHDATFQRMFSRLLQWMQDNQRGCFVFATANDISRLPPEFLRKGRFDKLWSVFLPTEAECIALFKEQMRRAEEARREEAKNSGQAEPPLLFSRKEGFDCFSDGTMKGVMACFRDGKFLTGSDITCIVGEALSKLDDKAFDAPVRAEDWKDAVGKAAAETVTDAGSHESLNKLAACYIRLLRGPFQPVSRDEALLFLPGHYKVTNTGAEYDVSQCPFDDEYDKALFGRLRELINRHAPGYEELLQQQEFSAGLRMR